MTRSMVRRSITSRSVVSTCAGDDGHSERSSGRIDPSSQRMVAGSRNPEAGQPRLTSCWVDQDVRRLDVFVDDPPAVYLTKCPSKTSGEPQKDAQLQSRLRGRMPTERAADRRLGEESRQ
jgi:hypothetical protein